MSDDRTFNYLNPLHRWQLDDSYSVGYEEGKVGVTFRYEAMQESPELFGAEWKMDAYCEGYLDGKGDLALQDELQELDYRGYKGMVNYS